MRDKVIEILMNSGFPLSIEDLEDKLNLIDVDEVDELNRVLSGLINERRVIKTADFKYLYSKETVKQKNAFKFTPKMGIALASFTLILVLFVTMGSSYSWLTVDNTSSKTNTITSGNLSLTLNDTKGLTLSNSYPMKDSSGLNSSPYTFSITNNGTVTSSYTIYLKNNDLESGKTRISDEKLRYSLIKNKNIYSGAKDLSTLTSDNEGRIIANGTIDPNKTINFDLRLWINENAGTEVNGTSFSGKISMEAEQLSNTPNEPNISSGMIPVTYDATSNSFIKADGTITNNWYNYSNKIWANIALINNSTYLKTLNDSPIGTKIDNSYVAGYFVWIPRISYSFKELPFNVKFLSKDVTEKGDVKYSSNVPENFYTSSAFNFDNNIDGFYISKYELTGSSTKPTSLYGTSIRNLNVSSLYNTVKNIGGTLNYTFSGDIHMIKNDEWDAASILAESIYGINGDITKNSSTTGNTSGVYMMNSGASEYVMGIYNGSVSLSGFATLPDSKYYNNYDDTAIYSNSFTAIKGLYNGVFAIPNATYSFVIRGDSDSDSNSSIFSLRSGDGSANPNYSTRIVITN